VGEDPSELGAGGFAMMGKTEKIMGLRRPASERSSISVAKGDEGAGAGLKYVVFVVGGGVIKVYGLRPKQPIQTAK
jgi:hypothetical protein